MEEDHVHMLVQSIPTVSVTRMVTIIKSITAREIFKQYPRIKKEILWGGNLWTSGYYANTVGMYASRDTIEKYIRNQGKEPKEYKKLYEGQLAVLTGCLRVSKESIFTGINNFKVLSITDVRFDEEFGFTENEVGMLLSSFGLEGHMKGMKAWYDGYRFGGVDVYCPWDVINHVDRLRHESDAVPQSYWINSSGNDLVRRFIDKADQSTRDEIEILLSGETIEKEIHLELTYGELDNTIDNLWSVLFTTGYLTLAGKQENGIYKLRIPNEEVKEVYRSQIREWFKATVKKEKKTLDPLWTALRVGDSEKVEEVINGFLSRTISIFDIKGSKKEKEKFYSAFLTGILLGNPDWGVRNQRESGNGLPDIEIRPDNPDEGIIIEAKSMDKITQLDSGCREAIEQVYRLNYASSLLDDGRCDIWIYGIAFYKKRCRVRAEKFSLDK